MLLLTEAQKICIKKYFCKKRLDKLRALLYNNICCKTEYAAMAQVVEHILGKDEVPGSSPGISSKNPVHESGRDFYFLLITSSLLPQNKVSHGIFWEVISNK